MKDVGTLVLGIGFLAMGLGLLWPWIERFGLDRLGLGHAPGDLSIDHGEFHFRLPLGSAIVIAIVVAVPLLLWKHALS